MINNKRKSKTKLSLKYSPANQMLAKPASRKNVLSIRFSRGVREDNLRNDVKSLACDHIDDKDGIAIP